MRILVCASEAPLEPLNGMRLQLRALCEQLARRHEVCVLAYRWLGQNGDAPEGVELVTLPGPAPGPLHRARERALALMRSEPVEVRRLGEPMAAALGNLLERRSFDVAHVTLGVLAGAAPALRGLPAVVAPLDAWAINVRAEAAGASGVTALWRQAQLRAVERFVAHAYRPFHRVVLVTDEDAAATVAADPELRTAVIPNGVDTERFRPDPESRRDERTLLFTGILGAPANERAAVRLAQRVLPGVRETMPDARLVLAGRAPSPRVAALATEPGVSIVEDVPDLRPVLAGAGVYACAMETGTGIKNKLLEAMACGAAAVATPLACQGLRVRDGEQLLIAASDQAFERAVIAVLGDAALRERLGAAARRYVEAHHDWAAVARAYEALYAEIEREPAGA